MPTHVWDAIDVKRELVLHHLIHLRRWRNIIASPFFRLPTELILDIFVHAVELNRRARFWVILTAVCHRLREMLIHSSLPWSVVDTDSIRLAKLFLERNRFDPHVLFATNYSWFPKVNTRRAALWEELEGRTFNNLRLLVFRGPRREFDHRVVDLLRRTPNLSSLEIGTSIRMTWDLEWPSGDQLPHLTMLRLSHVRISWAAPLLRNLTKLILNFICTGTPHESTSIQTFLNALKNCPDLESLQLAFAGPDLPDNNQGDSKVVVRLRKLQILVLQFDDQKVVECILSHIWFPESTKVEVETSCHAGLYAAISQVLPLPNVETSQYLRRTGVVTINFNVLSYELATDNFHFVLLQSHDEGRGNHWR
ncbi:hypothetical protein BDM02DRAFT_1254878 [Thelephora ganbajun]|uniref:Uncharacterized protein n=1 Tax=Thelephora ganbajun TaxID=370292 RepID=A0ACB6ZML0_THEGA|nr:hypothetical protein BDM02DRAFT_1254878 [Thelephora ganbajun]